MKHITIEYSEFLYLLINIIGLDKVYNLMPLFGACES